MREQAQVQHTPGPWHATEDKYGVWRVGPSPNHKVASLLYPPGDPADLTRWRMKANAERIVHCCNTHDELVEALRDAEIALASVRAELRMDAYYADVLAFI
jgi:hypothetical protein